MMILFMAQSEFKVKTCRNKRVEAVGPCAAEVEGLGVYTLTVESNCGEVGGLKPEHSTLQAERLACGCRQTVTERKLAQLDVGCGQHVDVRIAVQVCDVALVDGGVPQRVVSRNVGNRFVPGLLPSLCEIPLSCGCFPAQHHKCR